MTPAVAIKGRKLGCVIFTPRPPVIGAVPISLPVDASRIRLGTTTITAEAFEVSTITGRIYAKNPATSDPTDERTRHNRERYSDRWFAIHPADEDDGDQWEWEPDEDRADLTEIIF